MVMVVLEIAQHPGFSFYFLPNFRITGKEPWFLVEQMWVQVLTLSITRYEILDKVLKLSNFSHL